MEEIKSLRQVTKSDGRKWTYKLDKNRFLFPDEYIKFEAVLKRL